METPPALVAGGLTGTSAEGRENIRACVYLYYVGVQLGPFNLVRTHSSARKKDLFYGVRGALPRHFSHGKQPEPMPPAAGVNAAWVVVRDGCGDVCTD